MSQRQDFPISTWIYLNHFSTGPELCLKNEHMHINQDINDLYLSHLKNSRVCTLTTLTDGKCINAFNVSVATAELFLSFLKGLHMLFAYIPRSLSASESMQDNSVNCFYWNRGKGELHDHKLLEASVTWIINEAFQRKSCKNLLLKIFWWLKDINELV